MQVQVSENKLSETKTQITSVSVEEVQRILDIGVLLRSVLTDDEISQLQEHLSVHHVEKIGNARNA